MSNTDYHDAVQNFILSQKLTALLGSFPEVLISASECLVILKFRKKKITKDTKIELLRGPLFLSNR